MEDYLYKITVEIDDDKVKQLNQHDLDAVYQTVCDTFIQQDFRDVSEGRTLIFTMMPHKDAFSNVGIVTTTLYDSWLGTYLKSMIWYKKINSDKEETEDLLKCFKRFYEKYGK